MRIVVGSVVVAAVFGAILGAVLTTVVGLDQVTILAITFTVSAASVAAYAAVAVGTFVVTISLVFLAIEHLD